MNIKSPYNEVGLKGYVARSMISGKKMRPYELPSNWYTNNGHKFDIHYGANRFEPIICRKCKKPYSEVEFKKCRRK